MFAVEVYAAVRQFVFIDGNSRREAARVFGLNRETIAKMCRFSLPPGYTRSKPVEKPKLGPLLPAIDGDPGCGPDRTRQATPHGQADLRAPARRARLCWRLHGGEGPRADLHGRSGQETFVPLVHPPGHAQVDFGGGGGDDRRRASEDPFLLHEPAALRCLLREGVSAGDHRGVPRRACRRRRVLRGRAAVDPLRQHQDRGGQDLRRWPARAHARLHRTGEPLPVPGSLRTSGPGQRQGQGRGPGQIRPVQLHDPSSGSGLLRGAERGSGATLPDPAG